MIIDHKDAPKSIHILGVSSCMAGGADLILDLVTTNATSAMFPFEFLGGRIPAVTAMPRRVMFALFTKMILISVQAVA